jgi:hypothetical protein
MVRTYILTEREREIIQIHLKEGYKLNGHRELKHLTENLDLSKLKEDIRLIEEFLEKT